VSQNPYLARSCCVNAAGSTATLNTIADNELDAIFRMHYERVARLIGRVIHDQARAEEVAVDVFVKWWRTPRAHCDQAEGWLYRTAAREAFDEWRRKARRNRLDRMVAFFREAPATPERLFEASVEQQNVRAVLAGLSRRQAALLLLKSEDLSYFEIAAALGLNPHSVGSLLGRAQAAFRKEYVKRYAAK
jgi:RNA polymerase sigma-70 factor (ECF subfamily)